MDNNLIQLKTEIYKRSNLKISDFWPETESKEYSACRFEVNGKKIISRNGKIMPKKVGQFVTFWKRNGNGPIKPFHVNDQIDFYIVNVQAENKFGQFVFPKSILIKKGIISTDKKEGKRAFRVYPKWEIAKNKQAERTQKWQLEYFYEINASTDYERIAKWYENE